MSFTGIKDLDYKIMEELDIRSLLNFCLTDTYISGLCKNDMFWKRRFEQRIGYGKFKPADMSWRKYYLKLLSEDISSEGFDKPVYVKEPLINFLRNANFGIYTEEMRKALKLPLEKKIFSRSILIPIFGIWFRLNINDIQGERTAGADENMIKYLSEGLQLLEERKGINKNLLTYLSLRFIFSFYLAERKDLTNEEMENLNSDENEIMLNNLRDIVIGISVKNYWIGKK